MLAIALLALALPPLTETAPNAARPASPAPATVQASPGTPPGGAGRRERSGPAAAVGAGNPYAGIGLQLAYYQRLGRVPLHLVPYLSAGSWLDEQRTRIGFAAGGALVYGRAHRVLVEALYGVQGSEFLALHGVLVDARSVSGVHLGVGYEYLTSPGIFLRVAPGVSYPLAGYTPGTERSLAFALTAGLGWKLW